MSWAAPGLSPAAARLHRLLDDAATDGHTVVPVAIAGSVLGGVQLRLENALREIGPAGSGLVSAPMPALLGFRRLVEAEQAIASAVVRLAGDRRLCVVTGPAGAPRDAAARAFAEGEAAIADDAEYLDVETLAAFFASCEEHEAVVLTGDLHGLGSPGAGRGFADIAESGLADVVRVDADPTASGSVLRGFAAAVARGELPAVDDPGREVVTVAAASAAEAAHRVRQLVAESIPRAFGVEPAQIQVLTATVGGRCGSASLTAGLAEVGAPPAMTVHESLGRRWPAVVLALPPESAGVLSRALLHSAVTRPTRHLSIVHAAGAALSDAVRQVPARPRRTLLPRLLAGYSSSGSHSSSSSSSSSPASTGPNGVTSSYAENSASS
jgi:hypothetical protein